MSNIFFISYSFFKQKKILLKSIHFKYKLIIDKTIYNILKRSNFFLNTFIKWSNQLYK